MKIEDKRSDFVEVRDESIKIGDVVETHNGRIALIVWADDHGRPTCHNPGSNGLLYLDNCQSSTDWTKYPKVRKLNARLVIEAD